MKLKVGALMLFALALLGALIFALGDFSVGKGFRFDVDFAFTGNLHEGAPVKLAGLKVGKVESIRFLRAGEKRAAQRSYIRVGLWLEERVAGRIYEDAEFYVNTKGVLGEQYLEIVPGTPGRAALKPNTLQKGMNPPRFDLIVARLYEFLDRGTRLLRTDKKTISQLLRNSASAVGRVDQLLKENRSEIKRMLSSAEALASESSGLVRDLRRGVGGPKRINRVLGNVDRVTAVLGRRLDGVLDKTGKALDGVQRLAATVGPPEQRKLRKLLGRAVVIADRLHGAAGNAGKLLAGLARGKGSVGALLVKDEIYDDIKELVRDLKRNPWKFLWRQ